MEQESFKDRLPVLDFKSSAENTKALARLTVERGACLVKSVPDLSAAHALIEKQAVYSSAAPTWAHLKNFPATVEVSNIVHPETGRMGWFKEAEIAWHTNGACREDPENCVALFCDIPAASGGETEIINTRSAYKDLSGEEKLRLKNIHIRYSLKHYKLESHKAFDGAEAESFSKHGKKYKNFQPVAVKPLFQRHPVDHSPGLFFPWTLADKVEGFKKNESKAFLKRMSERVLRSKYRAKVKYEKHDLLFMDQIHTLHRRRAFQGSRRLYRICFSWKREGGDLY